MLWYHTLPMLPNKLAFVDIETTGGRSQYDRVIEIGILRVENGILVDTFNSLLNPQTHLPPEIEMLTGITMQDLEHAPVFREVANDIERVLTDCIFVAHNVRFDYSFLKHEFSRLEKSFSTKHFCTVKLSRALFPRFAHHNLDSIIRRFQIICKNRHRALDDAKVVYEFYNLAQKKCAPEKFQTALNVVLKKPSLPPKLTAEMIDTLPESPGVYLFYGQDNAPLYIGKSVNIRDRVLSHFSADLRSSIEMKISQQIERIDTITTAGELGALFAESKLIKTVLPLYNRQLRLKRELVGVRSHQNKDGYQIAYLEVITNLNASDAIQYIGFFRSKKQAKQYLSQVAKEYHLCEKLLDLEKTNKECFGYRLEQCKGACIGSEPSLFYNLRFTTAFIKARIRPWPFPGPIVLTEENMDAGLSEHHVIDKWCYLGSIKQDTTGDINEQLQNDYVFDLDMYKILKRYLLSPKYAPKIRLARQNELAHYSLSERSTVSEA